jgi:hypothetical protein
VNQASWASLHTIYAAEEWSEDSSTDWPCAFFGWGYNASVRRQGCLIKRVPEADFGVPAPSDLQRGTSNQPQPPNEMWDNQAAFTYKIELESKLNITYR